MTRGPILIFEPVMIHHHVFETARGFAAIGWGPAGITGFRLPDATAQAAERALSRRQPGSTAAPPPAAIAEVVAAAKLYFAGARVDFGAVPVDLGDQPPLFARIYALVRTLGWAETTTYGAIAKALGEGPEAARTVGEAMARNPVPLIIPCHRVTAAGGKIGGFSAPGGSVSKARMLELEGVALGTGPADQMSLGL